MIAARRVSFVIAGAALALAITVPTRAAAQGNGKGKDHKSTPPSQSVLLSPTAAGATGGGASPLAWIDDASVLAPGTMSVSMFALRWQGADLSEVSVPIVDIVAGLAPRVQLGASIPRVGGAADPAGASGVGTSYFSVKIAVPTGAASGVKLAVAPTLEVLGDGARQSLTQGGGRTQLGLPVMAEIERGASRLFGSAGYFSRGSWFAGGGVGTQASPRVAVSAAFSRAWTTDAAAAVVRDRKEISGGAALSLTPRCSVFGSLGRTVATADSDGAGTTVAAGVSLLIGPSTK